MMVLITGGSGSGKSTYAEACIEALSAGCQKYYIATMQAFDEESRNRIERHRKMSDGKGFVTIEQPVEVNKALQRMKNTPGREKTAILECVSNLTANEMFTGGGQKSCREVTETVVQGVTVLNRKLKHTVIVTNNVFQDGITYEEPTREYLKAMGSINERLAALADRVVEVVVGIPVTVKEGTVKEGK